MSDCRARIEAEGGFRERCEGKSGHKGWHFYKIYKGSGVWCRIAWKPGRRQ